MSDWLHGIQVPPLTIGELREMARLIRDGCNLQVQERFPVLPFLERALPQALPGFDFEVVDVLSNGDEARAYPDGCVEHSEGPFIQLTSAVYEGAWLDNGRDRLTVLHECAHVMLHGKVIVHRRGPRGPQLKAYENSEWQANQLAAELLMPIGSFPPCDSFTDFCRVMGVSRKAAARRIRKLQERGELRELSWPRKEV